MKTKSSKLWILAVLTVFLGCENQHLPENLSFDDDNQDVGKTEFVENSSFFEKQENSFGADVYRFVIADSKYVTPAGYTLWAEKHVNESNDFEPFSVRMYKESGVSDAGYGIIFCSQYINGEPYLLTVMINSQGYYTIGKVKNGVFSYIVNDGWKICNAINNGVSIYNTITVSLDEEKTNEDGKWFKLVINDSEITSFTVTEDITFKDSKMGYAAVVSYKENFPDKPVKITYEKR